MEHGTALLITIVAAVVFGLLAQLLAHRWRIPAIVLLLVFGIIMGKDVLGVVHPDELGRGLSILIKLAVAIILFEGALSLNLKSLRHNAAEVRNLVTIGVLVSWVVTTLIAHFIAGFDWRLAILFGALMTVTGPTVIQPLMRRISVTRSVKTVLEAEAILVDPIGAILAIAVLDILLATTTRGPVGLLGMLWVYFGRLLIGGVVGVIGAYGLALLMKAKNLVPSELGNLVALACVWGTFGMAEGLQSEAGIMATVIMGLVTQNAAIPGARQLRHFKEALTTLGISVLFILLAAGLDLSALWQEGISGILAVLLIMLVARPLAVFISTWRTRLTWRQKTFIAWVGPRGIIAASVASIFMLALQESGLDGGERLLALTFLTILMTVSIQGLSAGWVAEALGLRDMGKQKALIVGANNLGCTIAGILTKYDRPVHLVDTNLTSVERALQKGLDAAPGNALEEGVLEELHAEECATFLAVTSNSEVNVLACQLAHDSFGIERAFPALSNPAKGANPTLLKQTGGKLAFGRFITVAHWEKADAEIYELSWQFPSIRTLVSSRDIVLPADVIPILRIRSGSAEIVHAEQTWQPGDTIIILSLHPQSQIQNELDKILPSSEI